MKRMLKKILAVFSSNRKPKRTIPARKEIQLNFQLRFVKIGAEYRYFRTLRYLF